jgi:hypothetical protein
MAVRGVDHEHVDARLDQRPTRSSVSGVVPTAAPTRRRPARPCRRWGRAGLLDVLDGDHAAQLERVVDHQHLLDAVLVQQAEHLVGTAPSRTVTSRSFGVMTDETGCVEVGLEAQVAAGDDADQIAACRRPPARRRCRARGSARCTSRMVVGRNGDRIDDTPLSNFLTIRTFAGLLLDRHVLVDDADAALLGHRDRQARLGDGVHRGRDERDAWPG